MCRHFTPWPATHLVTFQPNINIFAKRYWQYFSRGIMITFEIWEKVISFIATTKKNIPTEGVLICGSLIKNDFRSGSDIDILFLNSELEFQMETIGIDGIIFDRIIVTPDLLVQILNQKTNLSNILSLSFGLETLVIEDSRMLRNLLNLSKKNISQRKLTYQRSESKIPHISNEIFDIIKIDGEFKLKRNGTIVT
jgi:hypothetical protein